MEPSHLMCDRSDTCKLCNTFTHAHMPYEQGSIVYGAEFIAASQKYQQKVTHVLTRIGTPIHTQECKNLFVIMAAYISCSHTQGCQTKFSTDTTEFSFRLKQTQTRTQTNTHSAAQVLGSIYCSATCRCNSSGMSIRAENGSFHSISHSNELQQNSLLCHTSTR